MSSDGMLLIWWLWRTAGLLKWLGVWVLVTRRWGDGSSRPASIRVTVTVSRRLRERNLLGFVVMSSSYGWNEIYSNEQRSSG